MVIRIRYRTLWLMGLLLLLVAGTAVLFMATPNSQSESISLESETRPTTTTTTIPTTTTTAAPIATTTPPTVAPTTIYQPPPTTQPRIVPQTIPPQTIPRNTLPPTTSPQEGYLTGLELGWSNFTPKDRQDMCDAYAAALRGEQWAMDIFITSFDDLGTTLSFLEGKCV